MEISGRGRRHVAVVPHPARGHVNPMINLSRLLAAREDNLLITFIVTEDWRDLIASALTEPLPLNFRIRSIPNVIPTELARGADRRGFFDAVYTKMEAPVEQLIERLEPPVDFVVTDSVSVWVASICKRRNIPVASFWTQAATVLLAMHMFQKLDDDGQLRATLGREDEALAYLPEVGILLRLDESNTSEQDILRLYVATFSWFTTAHSLLLSTFYELESDAIDTLKYSLSPPIYSLGPSIPHATLDTANATSPYIEWLDSQAKCSVLYVAFGSTFSTSDTQIDEMIKGLNASGIPYLWVVREECEKMKELSGEVGLVVPWCDQPRVLCHPSIGGFLTHCGWNSTLEGVYAGVPMLTFPIAFDQYPNGKLIVDAWKIGLRLMDDATGKRVVGREEVAEKVKKLMDLDAEEGKGMRRRAMELMHTCQGVVGECGSSSTDLDTFVLDIIGKK